MTLSLVTGPATEPVDLADAKLHLRVVDAAEDVLIAGLLSAARLTLEAHGALALLTQTWRWSFDQWPGRERSAIDFPMGPVSAILSVTVDGVSVSPADYVLVPGRAARLVRTDGGYWPKTKRAAAAIVIEFEAGFGADGASVPRDLRHAILMLVADWFENREPPLGNASLPRLVLALIAPYRQVRL